MHQKDTGIINKSNVQSDVVVVNQCDHDSIEEFDFVNKKGETCHAKFINTTERGLSRSRNMAIRNAWGDICQICDDDEWLADDGEDKILKTYKENPDVGLIAFALIRKDVDQSYPIGKKSIGLKEILRTSSQQITFSRILLKEYGILFDEKMGSGTGNGGGEENRFMLDWRKAGAKMLYIPDVIATVNPGKSQWFKGYTEKYFQDRGWTSRRNLGIFWGFLFIVYNWLHHRKAFVKDGVSFFGVFKNMIKGYFDKR